MVSATTRQDESFLPYTLNRGILFSNGADGVAGTADDVFAADLAPPRPNLDGEVQTTRLDLRLTSRPLDALSLRARWSDYEYDDKSAAIDWPGYVSSGDSYFRRNVGKKDAAGNKILINEVADYTRTQWSVGGAWSFGHLATIDLEYGSTKVDYEHRQVEATNDDRLAVKLRLEPVEAVELRFSYLDASRDFEGDYEHGLETSRIRAFDVWNRNRTRWGAELDWSLG